MKLIDADALLKELEKLDWQELYLPVHFKEWLIDDAPTIDAVEVVRCRECIRWIEDNPTIHYGHCANMYVCTYGDGYCSYGERINKDA